ncbi:MAG: PP0621 family protein [Gammaproteobacteria bacterium]
MGLFRLLIILALAYLAYRLYLAWRRSSPQAGRPSKGKARGRPQVENIVRCEVCQLHIPESEAIEDDGRYYCSQKHLQQDQDQ